MNQSHMKNCTHVFSSRASAVKGRVFCRPMCDHKQSVLIGLLLKFSVGDNITCL